MSDIKIHLAEFVENESPQDYVRNKLVPAVAELHRITNEFILAGSTEENSEIDMIPQNISKQYNKVEVYLETVKPKSCTFSIQGSKAINFTGKTLKALFRCVAYSEKGNAVAFRLVNSNTGKDIKGSNFQARTKTPTEFSFYLPIGNQDDRINEHEQTYHIEAKYVNEWDRPICRRFSLSLVYV